MRYQQEVSLDIGDLRGGAEVVVGKVVDKILRKIKWYSLLAFVVVSQQALHLRSKLLTRIVGSTMRILLHQFITLDQGTQTLLER